MKKRNARLTARTNQTEKRRPETIASGTVSTQKRIGEMRITLATLLALALLLVPETPAFAATLIADTNLLNGTPIPTDAGSFDETDNTAPYVYNIDDDPGNVTLQNRVALDMAGYDLNNTGANTQDITINAASISYTSGGGEFTFTGTGARPNLTINATGAMSVWKVRTNGNTSGATTAGAIAFSAPDGITVGSNLEAQTTSNNSGNGGAISLTSTGGSGSIQIGGSVYTYTSNTGGGNAGAVTFNAAGGINVTGNFNSYSAAGNRIGGAISLTSTGGSIQIGGSINTYQSNTTGLNGGNLTLTAASGIGVTGNINTSAASTSSSRFAGDITMNGGTGPVSIGGTINANAGSGGARVGDLNITTSGAITLGTLDKSLLYQVSLQGSSVAIDTLLNLGISGSEVTGFHNVSSDVLYNPANNPSLGGLTYNIIEGNGDTGGYQLKPTIADTTPPDWITTWPMVDTPTSSGFTVRAQTNEDGTAYFVVLADGATAPSAAQVKAGTDASDAPAITSGSIPLSANVEATAAVAGLNPGTAYDVYFVAQDAVPNLQASPALVSVTTLATLTAYQAWAAGFQPSDVSDPALNFDGDTLTNLQEFAFGTNPTVSTGEIVYSGGTLTHRGLPKSSRREAPIPSCLAAGPIMRSPG